LLGFYATDKKRQGFKKVTSSLSDNKIANMAKFYIAAAMTPIARFTELSD
jgi:cytochrome c553